uniref:Copia protein n=1 Tax=Tanacetum cinerariifolium TaxID=118510 RepID=A0A6L2MQH8_TANCI|nr:copia protein [Tanacetum cinerariifolium]
MEKSTVSTLLEEKKKLKSDFKIHEDELLDKQIQLENKIKELDNILVKMGHSIQTMHMLSLKPDSFYHIEQKMALGYQNPFYLKQAQQKQQSLYNGKVLFEKHDPPVVHDSEKTLQLAQENFKSLSKEVDESLAKHKSLELEIKRLLRAVKLENENVELKFQVLNYAKENAHLKTTYKNLFDSISMTRTQTKTIIDSLQNKLHDTIYENSKLRAQLFDKVSEQKDTTCGMSANTKFAKQSILGKPPSSFRTKLYAVTHIPKSIVFPKVGETHTLSKLVSSNSIPPPQESKVMKNDKVIASGMFRINPFKPSREEKVYFVEGLGHNLFSIEQFCDLDLDVPFRRNACFVRNLKGVDLLTGNCTTNLYTINLHEMASASPICLMARVTSTKSWLWHQRLSHLNFDTINDLAKNNLVTGLPKFKYHKEHLCPFCEQGKSKRASHPPKPVQNSRQRIHLLHMDLCGPIRIASINENRTDNSSEFKKQVLKEYFDSVGISHQVSFVRIPQQNGVVERRNQTLVEAARTMLIFSRAPLFLWAEVIATTCYTQNCSIIHRQFNKTPYELINIRKLDVSFLHVFGALCYPKNDREDIGKLGAKGDIGFFIGYSADSCAYRVYNRRTKKIIETMNVTFDELSTMAFEQSSSKPRLQNTTSGQISSGLDLTYAPSTISTQQPTEGELDLLFDAMYDDYIGDTTSTPTNSSSHATNFPNTSHDVDGLKTQQQQHAQQQGNQAPLQPKSVADNVSNAMFDENTFVNPFATPSTILARNQLRSDGDMCMYALTVSTIELKNVKEAMTDPAWIESMQEELLQFKRLDVWVLVPAPDNNTPLTLKWLFKNKHDEENTNHFFKGTIDPTLFIRHFFNDILVVQVYVDDIIFGSTHPKYTHLFSDLMKSQFEMSMVGEMTFFLGLQVNQSLCGIFINQSNYVLEIIKKYGMESCDLVGTPMKIKDKLDLDQNGTSVNATATKYRSMIGALMYLTSSRPNIVHATCLCARYQAKPIEKHLKEVKRIFRYLQGTVNTGLWYSKDSGFELTGFSDVDYVGCKDTFKSTFGGAQFLGKELVSWSSKKQDCTTLSTAEAEYVSLSACCAQVLWMRTQLTDYGFHFNKIPLYCDSKSTITISCNPVQHSKTKHIAVRYHFIKEHVEKGTIELYFVKTDYQLAGLFTKALPADRFNYLVRRLGMRSLSP